jgi:hypothetical protein
MEGVCIKVKLDLIRIQGVHIKVKGVRIKTQLDCNFPFSQLDLDQSETCRYTNEESPIYKSKIADKKNGTCRYTKWNLLYGWRERRSNFFEFFDIELSALTIERWVFQGLGT